MSKKIFLSLFILLMFFTSAGISAQDSYEHDTFSTQLGDLELWFIGHGTLMFKLNELVIHIDPVRREGDYNSLPGADFVFITHAHGDHLDPAALKMICDSETKVICNISSADRIEDPIIMKNGDSMIYDLADGNVLSVEAVPAYNIKHQRSGGVPFHPEGDGNGYVLSLAGKRIYVAGDTENIPEMAELGNIDIAFLPMNLPYTMSPDMAAKAARSFMPRILYPYHFGSTNTDELLTLLEGSGIDVRIRKF